MVAVRHGETVWNLDGRQQGHLHSELTPLGVRQAQAMAEGLAGEHFDALYSSDLGRAMQTAQILAERLELDVRAEPGLRERHLGMLQGLTMAEFRERYPEHYARLRSADADYVIPEGESARQRHRRCVRCAAEIAGRHPGGKVLVIAHGGVLNSFFRHALGLAVAGPRRFCLYNGSINRFRIEDGEWSLVSWGETHHLRGIGTRDDW
jgi:probable phosphoglycerate mutase